MIYATSRRAASLTVLALAVASSSGRATAFAAPLQAPLRRPPNTQRADGGLSVIIKSQHRRLPFPQDIQRIAVGDSEILSAELITSREVLVLGKGTGRTTLIVWFTNGSSREYLFSVERDLSVLERTLKLVNPSIEVESAPDRDVLVLTGLVPDEEIRQKAEKVARYYLDAGGNRRGAEPILVAPGAPTAVPDPNNPPAPTAPAAGPQNPPSMPQGQEPSSTTSKIINLLQVTTAPPLPEEELHTAIRAVGGEHVTVRRLLGDAGPILVLEGRVPNQIALVRVLTLAARLFASRTIALEDIRVIADESGALTGLQQAQSQTTTLGGGATSSLFGGARGARLTNQVRTNLGRAKAVQVAEGRILSFIEVVDLPQVRVDIRLEEVDRTKLRAFDPNSALATSDFRQPSLNPAQSAVAIQGGQAARVGTSGAAVQNVLSFLGGGLLNQTQFSGNHAAIDAAFSLLEREGVARTLSSPSLTVLSGELAQVQVGGEIPVPTSFAPAFGGANTGGSTGAAGGNAAVTPGVFSGVEFVPFGVQLQIRPLVGDDDTITLDVQPQVVTPDAVLTDTIRQSTGSAVPTTAFQTRALRTSSRLQDGQALLIGGLTTNNTSSNTASTPGLRDVPILGRLFQGFNRNDQSTVLVVVVNPVVLRTPLPATGLWAFPDRDELIRSIRPDSAARQGRQ